MNAPNLYFFLPQSAFQISLIIGIILAGLILLAWVLIYGYKRYSITHALITFAALVSLAMEASTVRKK